MPCRQTMAFKKHLRETTCSVCGAEQSLKKLVIKVRHRGAPAREVCVGCIAVGMALKHAFEALKRLAFIN